jgi:hypothetical protein
MDVATPIRKRMEKHSAADKMLQQAEGEIFLIETCMHQSTNQPRNTHTRACAQYIPGRVMPSADAAAVDAAAVGCCGCLVVITDDDGAGDPLPPPFE